MTPQAVRKLEAGDVVRMTYGLDTWLLKIVQVTAIEVLYRTIEGHDSTGGAVKSLAKNMDRRQAEHLEKVSVKRGDVVKIKPQYQDKGDDQFTWVAIEDDDGGRVRIKPNGTGLNFPGNQVVQVEWLQ